MRFLFAVLLCAGLIENTCCQNNGGLFSVFVGPWSECHRIDSGTKINSLTELIIVTFSIRPEKYSVCIRALRQHLGIIVNI